MDRILTRHSNCHLLMNKRRRNEKKKTNNFHVSPLEPKRKILGLLKVFFFRIDVACVSLVHNLLFMMYLNSKLT